MNRRDFLRLAAAGTGLAISPRPLWAAAGAAGTSSSSGTPIDRRAVVRRHNPDLRAFDPFAALSVGNGEFAFTTDITGLQTFAAECEKDFPLCTMAHWAWHSSPVPAGAGDHELRLQPFDTYGRAVGYATDKTGQEPLFDWLRENPHGLHLGQIGFVADTAMPLKPADVVNPRQQLDLWSGVIDSQFELHGQPVHVTTCAHPTLDAITVRVQSPLLPTGRLRIRIAFPYGSPEFATADWNSSDRHQTELVTETEHRISFRRTLDGTAAANDSAATREGPAPSGPTAADLTPRGSGSPIGRMGTLTCYDVALEFSEGGRLSQPGPHEFLISSESGALEFTCLFSPSRIAGAIPSFSDTRDASAAHWDRTWTSGGFVDFGGCTDARAAELERRTILSLYQTAIHCAGSLPSAETGLLHNTWYGKFHLEMHWWHSVHFVAWNRFAQFERSMGYYRAILGSARERAQSQGYRGARWPKMTDASGRDSPSPIGPLLIWQQPHPIYYAELFYRERPTSATLDQWREVVFASADFMASYAHRDLARDRYVLGPPLKTVSENTEATKALNPTFELAYWRFGLRIARAWRARLGLAPEPTWEEVHAKLSALPSDDGCYLLEEGMADTYTKWNWEHPAHLGAFGVQPGDGVDPGAMRRTLRRTIETWKWDTCWGWDFPMAAMCAARVGEPELAIRALLIDSPKNRFHPNGHNYQRPGLTAYLPGNGGLLAAIAMMAQGWTGGPSDAAPGFPRDGKWAVRHENLRTWL